MRKTQTYKSAEDKIRKKLVINAAKKCTFALLAFLSLIALIICFTSCNKLKPLPPAASGTTYDIALDFAADMKSADISQEIFYTNETSSLLTELVLRLYANAYKADNGKIEVLSLKIDNQSVDFELSGDNNTVLTILYSLKEGDSCNIEIDCLLTLPEGDSRLGTTKSSVNLTGFYPVMAIFENGAWRKDDFYDFGDPFYSETASYYISVSYPESYIMATSGVVSSTRTEEGIRCAEITAENVRDYAMVLSTEFKLLSGKANTSAGAVDVDYYYTSDRQPDASLRTAISALQIFSENFGAYPYPHYTVVETPLNAGGMEYGTLAAIAPNENHARYLETVVHETAHQWWFGVVGSDQFNDAWLDEGLTEFCTGYYFYLIGDRLAYNNFVNDCDRNYSVFAQLPEPIKFNSRMNRHLSSFLTSGEYVAVTYLKGALMFDSLRTLIGDKKFTASLATYYSENAYRIADRESLVSAFEKNGCMVRSIIDGWVDGTAKI